MPATYVVTTLAMYQTIFWSEVAQEIRRRGQDLVFLSFDDVSHEYLLRRGLRSFNALEFMKHDPAELSCANLMVRLREYGLEDTNRWFSHERLTFRIRDEIVLRNKLIGCLDAAEHVFNVLEAEGGSILLVQELGGFLSVIASFHVARKRGYDNYFIEPSFFRGRLFFIRNNFTALKIVGREPILIGTDLQQYLQATVTCSEIVIPEKDKHHYVSAVSKLLNPRNMRRLCEKAIEKYVKGKRHEFGYIGAHVATHVNMLRNSWRLRNRYTSLDQLNRFVYFPLHVPLDVALTLRSPEYLDQLALVDYLARSVPATHRLAIKEHPAMIGALDASRLRALLRRYDNLALLPPSINNYTVLRAADVVVSVNSKAGAEAILLGKRVMVLGDAFYRESQLVYRIDRIQDIPWMLKQVLQREKGSQNAKEIECFAQVAMYFQHVWNRTFPGELYASDADNIRIFADSVMLATECNGCIGPQSCGS